MKTFISLYVISCGIVLLADLWLQY